MPSADYTILWPPVKPLSIFAWIFSYNRKLTNILSPKSPVFLFSTIKTCVGSAIDTQHFMTSRKCAYHAVTEIAEEESTNSVDEIRDSDWLRRVTNADSDYGLLVIVGEQPLETTLEQTGKLEGFRCLEIGFILYRSKRILCWMSPKVSYLILTRKLFWKTAEICW